MKNYFSRYWLLLLCCAMTMPAVADGPPSTDEPFAASFYLGEAIDTFAADETLNYINEQDSGKQKMRLWAVSTSPIA